MKSSRRLLAATAAATTAILVGALPASAATREFSTAGVGAAGYATGYLSVIYTGARTYGLTAWNDDKCGGDPGGNGMGAYLYIREVYGDGTSANRVTLVDNNGCNNGGDFVDWNVTTPKNINRVEGRLCEEDRNGPKASICTAWKSIRR